MPKDELDAVAKLNQNAVEYLLIGGYAMRFFGKRRVAKDVDVLTNNSTENADRLYEAIRAVLGFTPRLTVAELREPSKQIKLGARGPDLDIRTSVDGLTFDAAYQRRIRTVERGIEIDIVSKDDLLFIKRIAIANDPKRQRKEQSDIKFLESL